MRGGRSTVMSLPRSAWVQSLGFGVESLRVYGLGCRSGV